MSAIQTFSNIKTDPIRNFRYLVQFSPRHGFNSGTGNIKFDASIGFVSVSGLTVTVDPIAYREGGFNTTMHYLPGQATFTPIQFTRGQTLGGTQSLQWLKRLFSLAQQQGGSAVGTDFRCDVLISVLSHPNPNQSSSNKGGSATDAWKMHTAMKFRVYNAWVGSVAYGDLASGGNGLMVEGLTLYHEGFDVSYAKDYSASATDLKAL